MLTECVLWDEVTLDGRDKYLFFDGPAFWERLALGDKHVTNFDPSNHTGLAISRFYATAPPGFDGLLDFVVGGISALQCPVSLVTSVGGFAFDRHFIVRDGANWRIEVISRSQAEHGTVRVIIGGAWYPLT